MPKEVWNAAPVAKLELRFPEAVRVYSFTKPASASWAAWGLWGVWFASATEPLPAQPAAADDVSGGLACGEPSGQPVPAGSLPADLGVRHVAFEVDGPNLDTVKAHLLAAGIPVDGPRRLGPPGRASRMRGRERSARFIELAFGLASVSRAARKAQPHARPSHDSNRTSVSPTAEKELACDV